MRNGAGFTFLELMVVVAIGAVLFGGAIAAYRNMGDKQTVKEAGTTFQANLRLFQQKAQASEKPVGCLGTLSGFAVSWISNQAYQVQAQCSAGNPAATGFKLSDNQTVVFAAPLPDTILFSVLQSEVGGAQTITLGTGTVNYQVVIETGGVIRGNLL